MSRKRYITPVIVVSVLTFGASVLSTYQRTHHGANPPKGAHSSTAPASAAAAVPEVSSAKCHMRGDLPDPVCTPGSVDPAVTDANVASTICVHGYTATIRPSSGYTTKLKREQMVEYGFTDSISAHEEDHLISLELGGAAADPTNLWPEPGVSPNPKDKVENFLRSAVCAGRVSLSEAQKRIATDWATAEVGLTDSPYPAQ